MEKQRPSLTSKVPDSFKDCLDPKFFESLGATPSEREQEGEKILQPLKDINDALEYIKSDSAVNNADNLNEITQKVIFKNIDYTLKREILSDFRLFTLNNIFTHRNKLPTSSDNLYNLSQCFSRFAWEFEDKDTRQDIQVKASLLHKEFLEMLETEAFSFGQEIGEALVKLSVSDQKAIKEDIKEVLNKHKEKRSARPLQEKIGMILTEAISGEWDTWRNSGSR